MLKFIWQLPQNLVGLFLLVFTKHRKEGSCYRWLKPSGSISLGKFVFLGKYANSTTLQHEQGHQKQSLYLGWFYLLVIGIPSFLWASIRRLGLFKSISYYSFYTEKWADKLGNVHRQVDK